VAVQVRGSTTDDIWTYDLTRDTLTRLTFEGNNEYPIWTPDGKRITYQSLKFGLGASLYWKPADGSGVEERLMTRENLVTPNAWSSDGKLLSFHENNPKTNRDIWILDMERERKARPLLATPFTEGGAVFSPDNRWLAYVSDESGRQEVYVRPVSGSGEKWQVSTDGGMGPVWAHSGRELFYGSGTKLMVVDLAAGASFTAGKPRLLFEGQFRNNSANGLAEYDVTSDGQKFLMIQESGSQSAVRQLEVVQEWFSELRRAGGK
jgi:serine/threonine-protein kinase